MKENISHAEEVQRSLSEFQEPRFANRIAPNNAFWRNTPLYEWMLSSSIGNSFWRETILQMDQPLHHAVSVGALDKKRNCREARKFTRMVVRVITSNFVCAVCKRC